MLRHNKEMLFTKYAIHVRRKRLIKLLRQEKRRGTSEFVLNFVEWNGSSVRSTVF